MARKRADLAGHGMEILFGSAGERSPARAGETPRKRTPATSAPARRDPPRSEGPTAADAVIRGDWWAALEAEAKSAMPKDRPEPDAGAGRDPEQEIRRFVTSWMSDDQDSPPAAGPVAADEPSTGPVPAPRAETPARPTSSYLDDALPPLATTPALEPETSPSTLYAVPVVDAVRRDATPSMVTVDPLAPDGPRSTPIDLREPKQVDEEQLSRTRAEDEVLSYVGDDQRQQLWKRIVALYEEVPKTLVNDELQDEALQLLQCAQDILMEKPRQFDVAQYKVGQVQSILTRRRQTIRWTNTYGWLTFLYEGIWVFILAVGIFYAPAIVASITVTFGAAESLVSVEQLWNTATWGGVGGVLGALYSLYWHAAKVKDFDKQYLMWYVVQPVIGLIIGATLHVIVGAGFLTLIGEPAVTQGTPLRLFPYALAVVAAFRQRFILELVDRVVQFVTRTGDVAKTNATEKGTSSTGQTG